MYGKKKREMRNRALFLQCYRKELKIKRGKEEGRDRNGRKKREKRGP